VPSTSPHGERGFTLVEALVALLIVGLAIAAAIEAVQLVLHAQAGVLRQREAAAVAEWKLNELATLDRDSLATLAAGRSGEVNLHTRYQWRAMAVPEPGSRVLWRAAVVVDWGDGDLALETLLWRAPMGQPDRGRR